eukprot:708803-Pyramimonas_sp.AAC.1
MCIRDSVGRAAACSTKSPPAFAAAVLGVRVSTAPAGMHGLAANRADCCTMRPVMLRPASLGGCW